MQEFRVCFADAPPKSLEICGPADITAQTTDAIVSAANSSLLVGGGVDGAIHRAGGPTILEECRAYVAKHGSLPAGQATLTSGGRLKTKFVIHTVGPVYRGGDEGESELLANCHRESLRLADEHGIKSLAFPAISTGAYGYPLHEAAAVAVRAVLEALKIAKIVERVRFVLFDQAATKAYIRATVRLLRERRWADYAIDNIVATKPN